MRDIREIFAASDADRIAVALHRGSIEIWDSDKDIRLHDFGDSIAWRLHPFCLDRSGHRLLLGSALNSPLRCFDTVKAEPVWERSDLTQVAYVSFSYCGNYTHAGSVDAETHVLSTSTGKELERYVAADWLVDTAETGLRLIVGKPIRLLKGNDVCWTAKPETFAVLSACFGVETCLISEAGGPVRCLSVKDGAEVWRYDAPPDSHVLKVEYISEHNSYYGVEWPYGEGGPCTLIRFGDHWTTGCFGFQSSPTMLVL